MNMHMMMPLKMDITQIKFKNEDVHELFIETLF